MRNRFLRFRPEGGDAGGNNGTPPAGGTQQSGGSSAQTVYIDADVDQLERKYGSKDRAIKKLWRDAKRARDGKRIAEEKVAQLEGKLGPDAVILTGDERKRWDAFVKLGKTPEELASSLTQLSELAGKVSKQDRQTAARRAAKVLQWDEDTAADVADKENLDIELVTEKVDGADVEVPYVKPAQEGAARVKLADFAPGKLKLYLPALQGTGGGARGATDSARGTPWIEQTTARESSSSPTAPRGPNGGASALPLKDKRMLPSQRKAAQKDT